MTLVEFLLARIAEDEARANSRYEPRDPFGYDVPQITHDGRKDGRAPHGWLRYGTEFQRPVTQEMFDAWFKPKPDTRLLAECEAKRRIVEWVTRAQRYAAEGQPGAFDPEDARALTHALRLLALPYADHPDYREEWRP